MYYTRLLCFSVVLLTTKLLAQDNFALLGEPAFAINTELSYKYQMNFGLRSRHLLYSGENLSLNTRQVDLMHFSTLKLDLRHSISFGVMYRNRSAFEDLGDEFRLTQQVNIIKRRGSSRFGHRLRIEQRLFENLSILRVRYRFAYDRPLNGPSLDLGETYCVQYVEAVTNYSENFTPFYDLRLTSQIGWLLTKYLRLQAGLEYRLDSLNQQLVHRVFILTTAILKV